MKTLIKKACSRVIRRLHRKPCILFESAPDFSDNTYAVFCQMVQLGLQERYMLVWSCSKQERPQDLPEQVRCVYPQSKSLGQKLRSLYYMAGAKCLISCNRYLVPWDTQGQWSIFLSHGTPMKSVRDYYAMPAQIHCCLSAGKGVEEMTAYQFRVEPEKMVSLGFPRNDVLTRPGADVKAMLGTQCRKVLVWYPTFRQHKNGLTAGSGKALPIIHDAAAAQALNQRAGELDVLLVLKPHFAQDLTAFRELELSNIRFIDDSFFADHQVTSYEFVAGCDSLITDYSSIYFDYMLCDKPIGLVWEDVEEYRQKPGFAVDIDRYGAGGVQIYTLEDFQEFLRQVAEDEDVCAPQRRQLCSLVNYATDGQNAHRVTQYIIHKAKL